MPGKKEKEKTQKKTRGAVKPTGKPSQGELSEKDLEKVTGGAGSYTGKRQHSP